MEPSFFEQNDFLKSVIDTIPSFVFIVDPELRVLYANSAAVKTLAGEKEFPYRTRGGEILRCTKATPELGGCGQSESCRMCAIRTSVQEAFQGAQISRRNITLELLHGGTIKDVHFSISASPLQYNNEWFALLLLEDISELIDLRSILPICFNCKRIRNDEGYWQRVDKYFHTHLGVDFSHSICPDCLKKLYPERYLKIIGAGR